MVIVENQNSSLGAVLALDVGEAHIGLAISDELGLTAQPCTTVSGSGRRACRAISEIIEKRGVSKLLIGLPLELDGKEGPQAKATKQFVDKLVRYLSGIPFCADIAVEFWDERMSSREAERLLGGSGLKSRLRREALDRISASLILESYLESKRTS